MGLIRVDLEKCLKDGICVEVCPLGLLMMDEKEGPKLRPGAAPYCLGCGHCVAVCPHEAIDNVRAPLARQASLAMFPVLEPETAFQFLRSRRSIRRYKDDPVPRDLVLKLLDIARFAPSGHNSQGLSYIVVDKRESLKRISDAVTDWMRELIGSQPEMAERLSFPAIVKAQERGEARILRNAPLLIVAMAPEDLRPAQGSTYLALEYVELYATALGLGSCWAGYAQICAQQYAPLIDFLKIPAGKTVTGMLMAGYPLYTYSRLPERNPLDLTWLDDANTMG